MPRARARVMISVRFCFSAGNRQASQTVVGAQLDHENPHVAGERPVQTAQATCRRVARDAGVDHFVGIPCVVSRF